MEGHCIYCAIKLIILSGHLLPEILQKLQKKTEKRTSPHLDAEFCYSREHTQTGYEEINRVTLVNYRKSVFTDVGKFSQTKAFQ